MEGRFQYFLFGSDSVRAYRDGGVEAVLKRKDNDELSGHCWIYDDQYHTAVDVLDEYDGWMEWEQISKEEYEQLMCK